MPARESNIDLYELKGAVLSHATQVWHYLEKRKAGHGRERAPASEERGFMRAGCAARANGLLWQLQAWGLTPVGWRLP